MFEIGEDDYLNFYFISIRISFLHLHYRIQQNHVFYAKKKKKERKKIINNKICFLIFFLYLKTSLDMNKLFNG